MDNNTINKILQSGLDEIDNDINKHEEIREVSKILANRLLWEQAIEEYITNEYGETVPYKFILSKSVNPKNGTPTIAVYVINVHNMELASKVPGKQYRPAKYEAPLEGEFSTEQTVQTILSAAIAAIKGIILLDEEDDDDEN